MVYKQPWVIVFYVLRMARGRISSGWLMLKRFKLEMIMIKTHVHLIAVQLQTMAMKRANSAGSKPNIEMIPPGSHFSNILLQYQPGLIGGQLIRRYKRFLGDVEVEG